MLLVHDENGNVVSKLDYGKVYYSSAYLPYQKLYLTNNHDQSINLNTDCFTAEEYPASVKLIESSILNDCELDCIRMLLELPQFDITIPPKEKVEVRAYLVFSFTTEDLFAYSDHKRVGGTSYFRISLSLVFKSQTHPSLDSILTIHASACNSLLIADDTEIEFDSCIVGNTYVRDVQIWNRSECVLLYRITPHGGKSSGKLPFAFSDFESGKVISLYEQLSIPAFSSQRLRITLKAKVPCEVVRSIRFENDYNSSNIVILHCRISVTAKELADDLSIETESGMQIGGPFDFGDCYNGFETSRKVWIRNNSQDTVELNISSDSSMICFDFGTDKEKYLDRYLAPPSVKNPLPTVEREESSQSQYDRSLEAEDDDISSPAWILPQPGGSLHRYRDRSGKETLKFQSKDHRYSSNYFGIDEFSGDFNNNELCPGSEYRYRRYFNSRQGAPRSKVASGNRSEEKRIQDSNRATETAHHVSTNRRYRDSEVIVLTPGSRRQILIKLIPTMIHSKDPSAPMIHSKNPTEDLFDESLSLTKTPRHDSLNITEGVLTRRMMKIQLTWKKLVRVNTTDRYDLKQKQKIFTKAFPCRARCCTSVISVSPTVLDLGECNIGDLKNSNFVITNESDLPALILPVVESGSLELLEKEISIPPRQSRPCYFEFVARAVEDNYSKRITLLNIFNSHSNVQVEIRAKTIDTHQVLEHSALYKISTRNKKKQLQVYFENCISQMPNVRTFSIQNVSSSDLTFSFSVAHGSDLEIYSINHQLQEPLGGGLKSSKRQNSKSNSNFLSSLSSGGGGVGVGAGGGSTMDLESALDLDKNRRNSTNSLKQNNSSTGRQIRRSSSFGNEAELRQQEIKETAMTDEYLTSEGGNAEPPANSLKKLDQSASATLPTMDFISRMDTPGFPFALLESFEEREKKETPDIIPLRQKQEAQTSKAVALISSCFQELQEELQNAVQFHHIGGGKLRPLCTSSIFSRLQIPVGSSEEIVVILTPKAKQNRSVSSFPTSATSHHRNPIPFARTEDDPDVQLLTRDIKLNVYESDGSSDIIPLAAHSLKSRSVIVRARVFESEMVINQKNINFGKTVVGELSTRGLSITNKSSIPLLYSIIKSGNIASLFLSVSNDRERGMVPALTTKTIEFAFKPNLSGLYEETLILENVLNLSNSQSIIIKANVFKLQLFQLLPMEARNLVTGGDDDEAPEPAPTSETEKELISFLNSKYQETQNFSPLPPFILGTLRGSGSQLSFQFKLVNTSSKQRNFILEFNQMDLYSERVSERIQNNYPLHPHSDSPYDPLPLRDAAHVVLHYSYAVTNQPEQSNLGLTAEERKYLEDKREKISQKLVIAKRKENTEKILKYEKKLADLISKLEIDSTPPPRASEEELEGKTSADVTPISPILDDAGKLSFNVGADEGVIVVVTLTASLRNRLPPLDPLPACGMLKIYEGKNRDDVKYLYFGTSFLPSADDLEVGDSKTSSENRNYDPSLLLKEEKLASDSAVSIRPSTASLPIADKQISARPFFIEVQDASFFNSRKLYPRHRTPIGVILKRGLELARDKDDPGKFAGEFSVISEAGDVSELILSILDDSAANFPSECPNLFTGAIPCDWKITVTSEHWSHSLTLSNSVKAENDLNLRVSLPPGERVTCELICTSSPNIREVFTGLIGVRLSSPSSSATDNTDSKILPILCNTIREADIVTDKHVQFGEIHLGKIYTSSLTLKNKSTTEAINYSTSIVSSASALGEFIQIVDGAEGTIPLNGTTTLLITFDASVLGKFDHSLLILNRNSNSVVTVAVNAFVTLPQSKFVIYPDIDCDDTGKANKLDLGLIQVPVVKSNEFEYKFQFRILNTSSGFLFVSALSNLKKQVLIYSDEECTNMATNFPLEPGNVTALTIAIRPSKIPQDGAEIGRELVGGIRFIYFVQDLSEEEEKSGEMISRKVYESTVMFRALVGRSKLRITPSCTQFHCSRLASLTSQKSGLIKGFVVLENSSPTFPLNYFLPGVEDMDEVFSSKDFPKRMGQVGFAKFVVFDGCRGSLPTSSKKLLRFAVLLSDISGVMIKTLSFENLATHEIETIELKFFFDCRTLLSYYPSTSAAAAASSENNNSSSSSIYLPDNKFQHLPGLLYSQGFFVTELASRKISTPIWIAPFASKDFPSSQKLSSPPTDIPSSRGSLGTILPEPVHQDSIYITTGGEPVILFQWKITNPSSIPLRFAPASDLPITVSFESSLISGNEIKQIYMMPTKRNSKNELGKLAKSKSQNEEQRGSMSSLPRDLQRRGFSICGDVTTVPPFSTMTVKVGYKKGQPLNASHYEHLLVGDRSSINSVVVAGGIIFISAAQSLQSFFRPTESSERSTTATGTSSSTISKSGMGNDDTYPVIHYTPITCHFVVPALKIMKNQINLGLLRSYKPYYFTLEVENVSDVDIPFRIENISSWMFVLNAELFSGAGAGAGLSSQIGNGNDSKSSSGKKTNVMMIAKSKSTTTVEFKVNVPQDVTEKTVLHTLRVRNIALSTPQSYSLRDAVTVDISFEIDPFNPLQIKDPSGLSLQFSRHTHCQYLTLNSEVAVPRRFDVEPHFPSTGRFAVQNSSSFGLRLLPTLQCVTLLDGIVVVTLKRYEEGSGTLSLSESETEGIELLPGEMVKLSIELSSSQSSRLNHELLEKIESVCGRGDTITQDDDEDKGSSDELDEEIFGRSSIGPILLTKILLKFSPLIESSNWPAVLDGKVTDPSIPDEITIDVIGSLSLSPTSALSFPQSIPQHSIDFSAALSDGNIRTGIFWKCQPLNLPLHILDQALTIPLGNPAFIESTFRIICSHIIAIPEGNGKLVDSTQRTCENIRCLSSPDLVTIPSQGFEDISLEFSLQNEIAPEKDVSPYSELFEKFLLKYYSISQKANAALSSTILAIAILACYDLSYPLHPPLICPIFIKLVAEPRAEFIGDSLDQSTLLETPHSPVRREASSDVPSAALTTGVMIPTLYLRGVSPCLPFSNQFEINLGQQFQNVESKDWTLSLENLSTTSKLRYRISTLSPDDSKWLSLAQSGGTINAGGTASLILYFSLKQVGVFATYLIVENLTNPNDTCVIRTSLQVVQDWRRRNIFAGQENDEKDLPQKILFRIDSSQIIRDPGAYRDTIISWNNVDPGNRRPYSYVRSPPAIDFSTPKVQVIDFGQVFVGQRYTRRSFVIVNLADITLDFQLSSNISPRELSFSLTPVSPRTSCVVSVQPKEKRFIYVIFRPLTRDHQKYPSLSPNAAVAEPESEQCYEESGLGASRKFWKLEGSIFISCNLVKNHHETIKVYAHCGLRMFGAFAVKQSNHLFPVTASSSLGDEDISEKNSILQVSVPEHSDFDSVNSPSESISAVEGTSLFGGTDYSWHAVNSILIRRVDSSFVTPLQMRIYSCMKSFRLEVFRSFSDDQQLEQLPLVWAKGGGENGGETVDFEITSPDQEFIIRVIANDPDLSCVTENSRLGNGRNRDGHYCIAAEDHFMIYSRSSPIEKCRIPVRLLLPSGSNCSDLYDDDPISTASSVGSTLSFSGLEGIIISYFKEFSAFWSEVLSLTTESVIARSDVMQEHSFLIQNAMVPTNQQSHTSNFMISMTEHSQNNDYVSYGAKNGIEILTALEYFFVRLKYCLHLSESGMVQHEKFDQFIKAYPEEADLFPLLVSLSTRYLDICFHFGAITDLIVLYSMRQSSFGHEIMTAAHTGLPVTRLALLFYSVIFRHPVLEIISKIPPDYRREGIGSTLSVPLYPFAKQILYYGSFFSHSNVTDGNHDHTPLVDIIKAVKASFIDMKL